MTCHGVDKKVIGPSYKEVAAKYRGNKGAEADLIKKVKGGGKGVWGDDADAAQRAREGRGHQDPRRVDTRNEVSDNTPDQ